MRLIRPVNRYKYDEQEQILLVLNDINDNNCKISDVVCDNPKRSKFRCALCHNATYACEYCEAMAVLVQDFDIHQKTSKIKKKN